MNDSIEQEDRTLRAKEFLFSFLLIQLDHDALTSRRRIASADKSDALQTLRLRARGGASGGRVSVLECAGRAQNR